MSSRLVQVILLVEDLDRASASMSAVGLDVSDGGRHPGRGTANRIVALGDQYLELLAVVDPDEAAASPMGRPVVDALARRGEGPARWSVQAHDLSAESGRLGLPIERRSRTLPDGTSVRWHAVGVDQAWAAPWRCAFMTWEDPDQQPGRTPCRHPCQASGIAWVEVGVPDTRELVKWLGGPLPAGVRPVAGAPGPIRLALSTAGGELAVPTTFV